MPCFHILRKNYRSVLFTVLNPKVRECKKKAWQEEREMSLEKAGVLENEMDAAPAICGHERAATSTQESQLPQGGREF